MRPSPAFQVSVVRYGLSHAALLLLLAGSAVSLTGWFVSRAEVTFPVLAAAGMAVAAWFGGASLLHRRPVSLRWDTQQWHLGPPGAAGEEPWRGGVAVALDLGGWMLLRFEADPMTGGLRKAWLPVQRRGLEPQWHALRCAVYSPRPAAGHPAGNPPGGPLRHNSNE